MIPRLPGLPGAEPPLLVLIAVEDPQTLDQLTFALKTNHFRVRAASDGEEALRLALSERPGLVIADVRLARRGGLELCSSLRRDPGLSDVPIVLLSANADLDARVEALAHGADELVARPFAPKELLARLNRLVARGREAQRLRRRSAELERELVRLEADAVRLRDAAARARDLRVLAGEVTGAWLRTLDVEALDARLLREIALQSGARSVALLTAEGDRFVVSAVRGDVAERWQRLTIARDAGCLARARTLGRALLRSDLERSRADAGEAGMLAAHGVALLVTLAGAEGVEAVIVCEDRADGSGFEPEALDRLHALATLAGPVRLTARRFCEQQDRALAMLAAHASADPAGRTALREVRARLLPLAERWSMPSQARAQLSLAWEMGPWVWSETGRVALERYADGDPTTRLIRLADRVTRALEVAEGRSEGDRVERLLAAGLRYQSLRQGGRSAYEAWRTTADWLGIALDPELRDRFPEAFEPAHERGRDA